MLAGRLEDFMKVNAPDLGANVWGDLLESAIESEREGVRLRTSDVTRQKPQKKAGCLSGLVRSARMPVSPEEI